MTTTCEDLHDLMVAALKATDIAPGGVFGFRDWPTTWSAEPLVVLDIPDEDKRSLGPHGAPQFTSTAIIPVTGRVTAPATDDDMGLNACKTALADLRRGIEVAIINYPPLMRLIQQIAYVRSKVKIDADGRQHVGEVAMTFGLEFYQGGEDFYVETYPLLMRERVQVQFQDPAAPGGKIDGPLLDINLT